MIERVADPHIFVTSFHFPSLAFRFVSFSSSASAAFSVMFLFHLFHHAESDMLSRIRIVCCCVFSFTCFALLQMDVSSSFVILMYIACIS